MLSISVFPGRSRPPTFCQVGDSGTVRVWKGALQGEIDTEDLKKAIPFRTPCVHGHVDREKWEQKRADEETPAILKHVADRAAQIIGNSDELASCWNYANYYADETSHTFAHRDFNCNPDETVTLICFGGERMLAFCSCTAPGTATLEERYTLLPLCDGSILQFDGRWNMLHYHKILKEQKASEPRVSIQWFQPRDPSKWSQDNITIWEAHDSGKKHIASLKRRFKKDLESAIGTRQIHSSLVPRSLSAYQASEDSPTLKRQKLDTAISDSTKVHHPSSRLEAGVSYEACTICIIFTFLPAILLRTFYSLSRLVTFGERRYTAPSALRHRGRQSPRRAERRLRQGQRRARHPPRISVADVAHRARKRTEYSWLVFL